MAIGMQFLGQYGDDFQVIQFAKDVVEFRQPRRELKHVITGTPFMK